MDNANKAPKAKLPLGSAIAYTIGYSGINVSWYMINSYLMVFFTDIVGLAAGAISIIMLISRIWDAVNDPMMGAIIDRTNSKWGKFKPYIVIAPPFLAIFNVLTFTVFPLQGTAKAVVCLICYIGVGMVYTIVQVAVNGLVNRLSTNSQTKMDIISMSQIGSTIVQTILGAAVPVMLLAFSRATDGNPDGHGYFMVALIVSIVAIPMFWYCAWKCKEVKEEVVAEVKVEAVKKEKKSFLKSIQALCKNSQLVVGILSVFFGAMGVIARMSLLTYFVIYASGIPAPQNFAMLGIVFPVITFLQMLGNFVLPFATRWLGKKKAFIVYNIISAASLVLLFILPGGNVPLLIILSAIFGFGNAGSSVPYAFICDAIEYGDYKYGVRDDGLAFSLMSFGVKCATAITGAVGVLLIFAVGYVPDAVQTAETVRGISMVVNIIPAILIVISIVLIGIFYKLDEKKMGVIAEKMQLRREGAETREEQLAKYNL